MTAALDQLARISAERMLNSMIEGIAIGLFAWILLQLVGRRNSSTRFAVWFSALLAIAALPLIGGAASTAGPAKVPSAAIAVPVSWALAIFVVWAALATLAMARVAVGLWQLRKLRTSCTPIDLATLDPQLRATLQAFQAIRSVELCQSDRLRVPTAIGFLKPAVILPTWTLQELSTAEMNSILIHELAHLRRRDDWTNLAQQVVKALLFFHPAVWWIESKLALEREMACDDAVLAETANPRGYAQCLISIAEKSFIRRGLALAQAAVNRVHQTSLRVSQILDANRSRTTRVWKPALYSVAAFSIVCLVSLSHAPELVTFEDRTPELAIASAGPANRPLASPVSSNSFDDRAAATELSFHPKSDGLTAQRAVPESENFLRPHQLPQHTTPVPQNAYRMREGATSPIPQNAEYRVREGTSLLLPQNAKNNIGLQPLRQRISSEAAEASPDRQTDPGQDSAILLEARFVLPDTEMSLQATSTRIVNQPAPQSIFVVMQTARYDEAGPMLWTISVWRVTVLDPSRIPAGTRVPSKQI
jgi:beta-lactamase regulating signal transducer with metallopeptidase domain